MNIDIDIDKMNSILIYASLYNKYIPISIYENYIHPIHHRTECSPFLEIKKWMIDIIKYIKKIIHCERNFNMSGVYTMFTQYCKMLHYTREYFLVF